jgi:hypothetical protein
LDRDSDSDRENGSVEPYVTSFFLLYKGAKEGHIVFAGDSVGRLHLHKASSGLVVNDHSG